VGDKLLQWFSDHNATLSFVTDHQSGYVHILLRSSYSRLIPDLYAGCKLIASEAEQPKRMLDAVERLVEQLEGAANAK
jgi:hypothetical protein